MPGVAVSSTGAYGLSENGTTGSDGSDASESPTALCATTLKETETPLARPDTVTEAPVDVAVGPVLAVIVYPVMADPPLAGAVQETSACPSPATAATPVGAPGTA